MDGYFHDMPIPPRPAPPEHEKTPPTQDERRENRPAWASAETGGSVLPEDFCVSLAFQEEPGRLMFLVDTAEDDGLYYAGRGWFQYPQPDPRSGESGEPDAHRPLRPSFRVQPLGLLDPFLSQRRYIEPRHFKIVLRVIVPKLLREQVPLRCALTMSEQPVASVRLESLSPPGAEGKLTYALTWQAPRNSIRALEGLDGYVLAGRCLYRGMLGHVLELPDLPSGRHSAAGTALVRLGRLCDRAEYLFSGESVAALRALGRGLPPQEIAPKPSFPAPAPLPAPRPRVVEFPGPALLQAELAPPPAGVNRQNAGRYAVFLNEARILREHRVAEAQYVPFTGYWPTYAALNQGQRKWYFYWRGCFRDGEALKTDLSYVFLAVYELINNAVAAPPQALEQLLRLWASYREAYPYLDRSMPGWCVDYMFLNDLGTDFDALAERVPFHIDCQTHLAEIFCNRRLGEGLHTLPFEVLCTLSGYAMDKSGFYKKFPSQCREAARRALLVAEAALEKPPAEYFALSPRTLQWDSYRGAVCGRAASRRLRLTFLPYAQNEEFRQFLANVLRYTENLLRRARRFPGRLRCDTLPPAAEQALLRLFPSQEGEAASAEAPAAPQAPAAPLRIDLNRALELESASWDNTRRLLEAEGAQLTDAPAPDADLLPAATPAPDTEAAPAIKSPDSPPDLPTEPEADIQDSWQQLVSLLSPLQLGVLAAIRAGDEARALALCAGAFTFPDAVFEEINELALQLVGDALIDPAAGGVFEEYDAPLSAALAAVCAACGHDADGTERM